MARLDLHCQPYFKHTGMLEYGSSFCFERVAHSRIPIPSSARRFHRCALCDFKQGRKLPANVVACRPGYSPVTVNVVSSMYCEDLGLLTAGQVLVTSKVCAFHAKIVCLLSPSYVLAA